MFKLARIPTSPSAACACHSFSTIRSTAAANAYSSPATSSSANSRASLFVRDPDGGGDPEDREIYVMNADGTGVVRLTDNCGHTTDPVSWSPDGRRILFVSERDGSRLRQIYTMNADGTDVIRLTDNAVY